MKEPKPIIHTYFKEKYGIDWDSSEFHLVTIVHSWLNVDPEDCGKALNYEDFHERDEARQVIEGHKEATKEIYTYLDVTGPQTSYQVK